MQTERAALQVAAPVARVLGQLYATKNESSHAIEHVFLIVHVIVEGHGPHAESLANGAHGQGLESFCVDDFERDLDDLRSAKLGLSRH